MNAPTTPDALPTATDEPTAEARLLRINEVAAEVGTTTRAIRYYEEIGLLRPAARSGGDYRLYDPDDLERIRHIRELRDGAGFSLAEIGQLLEDEDMRAMNREAFRATDDPAARAEILTDSMARVERAVTTLRAKEARVHEMVVDAEARLERLRGKLADLTTDEGESTRPTAP